MGYVESLLAENEKIIVRTRQHWAVLARSLFLSGLAVLLIGAFALAIMLLLPSPTGLGGLVVLLGWVFPFGMFIRDYLDWWNEEYMVTNFRVIQSEGIINKQVMDSSLEKVNDVVLTQSFFGRIFDYGDIEILTASEMGVNRLHRIVSPIKFKTEMLNQKEALGFSDRPGTHRDDAGTADIPHLLAELDALRKQGILTEEEFQSKKEQVLSKWKP